MKLFLFIILLMPISSSLADRHEPNAGVAALTIIKDGRAQSEIVLSDDALPQVKFAAQELQDHLEKITGVKLPIVESPSEAVSSQIYVGESKYTRELGISTEDLKMEGFKIISTNRYLALLGRDATFPQYPRGFNSIEDYDRLTREWQEYTGRMWLLPFNGLYDPRNYNKKLGFSLYDPTGTLFSVYEFLEQQGVRWYSPYSEEGTVIPTSTTVSVPEQKLSRNPEFSRRFMRWALASGDPKGFLWFKRQKLGMSEMVWFCHGTPYVTDLTAETNPEYRAIVPGIQTHQIAKNRNIATPRLAPPLRDAMIEFGNKFFDRYPEMNTWAAAPADGFIHIDERDKEAGWAREERGRKGRYSDYVWTFVNDIAKGLMKTHPDKTVMGLAYTGARLVPENIEKLSPNVGVVYCQTRSREMLTPEDRDEIRRQRKQWLEKMDSDQFYIWEYNLNHADTRRMPGFPAIFTKVLQEDIQSLRGISKGEYVECSYGGGVMKNPALNHYPYMVQARLYWNPDLDLNALLDEYCTLYYGPAKDEMKEFFTFAEEAWMRPGSRDLSSEDRFIQSEDVDRLFDILNRAKAKAGNSTYGKRVAEIAKECEPVREYFSVSIDFDRGMEAFKAKDGEAAARHLRLAADQAQDSTTKMEALATLGYTYRDLLNNNAAAIDAWKELWKIPKERLPGNKRAIRMRGFINCVQLCRQEKRYDEALALLGEHNIEGVRGHWKFVTLEAYGDIANDQGEKEKAVELYQSALKESNVRAPLISAVKEKLSALQSSSGK